jgi:hypothetical protein
MFNDDHRLPDPEWIDRLLREDARAAAVIADDGFTARVMSRLPVQRPQTRTRSYGWIAPLFGAAAAAAVLTLSPAVNELLAPLRTLISGSAPNLRDLLPMVALAGAVYAGLWFSLNEQR